MRNKLENVVICEVKGDQPVPQAINQAITIDLFIDLLDVQRALTKLIGR